MGYGKTNTEEFQKPDPKGGGFVKDPRFFYPDNKPVDLVFCPPYAENLTTPHRAYKVHYNLGKTIVCLQSWNEPCPICDTSFAMLKRGKAGDRAAAALNLEIYARESYYYNVLPFVAPAPLSQAIGQVTHVVGFAPPAGTDMKPGVKIFRCGKKAHQQIKNFLQFNGDIFDPLCCNVINLSFIQQASARAGGEDYFAPMLNARPQKCRLHDGFLKMLEKATTKVEDNLIYDLEAVLLELKRDKNELKAIIDAKVAEFFAVVPTTPVTVPGIPLYGGSGGSGSTTPSTPPQTSVVVTAPIQTGAVPTVTPNMVTASSPEAPPKTIDPLAAFG